MSLFQRKSGSHVLVSVDFRMTDFVVAAINVQRRPIQVIAFAVFPLPSRREEDLPRIKEVIDSFLRRHSINARNAILTVTDNEQTLTKTIALPDLPGDEMASSLRWQLNEDAPFETAEALFGWQALGKSTSTTGESMTEALCAVIEPQTADRYLRFLDSCQLRTVAVKTLPINYQQLVKEQKDWQGIHAVLDFGTEDSTLCLFANGHLKFVRSIPISLNKLSHSLTETLVSERGKVSLTKEQAGYIQDHVGIPENEDKEVFENVAGSQIVALMRPLLEVLVREIKFSCEYALGQIVDDKPSRLHLSGPGAALRNLQPYLERELGMAVVLFPVAEIVKLPDSAVEERHQYNVINAVAAGMAYDKWLNLIPDQRREKRSREVHVATIRLIFITVLAVLGVLIGLTQQKILDYERRLKTAVQHQQTLVGIQALATQIRSQEALLASVQENHVPALAVVKMVGSLLPQEFLLTSLMFEQHQHKVTVKGQFPLTGVESDALLSEYMEGLEDSPVFTEVSLRSTTRDGAIQRFEISCQLTQEERPEKK